ncbi:type II toxin-antitoxin system VapC family toxin [Ammoniphilus sp. 3BR4]|uniref:type II toxin-antitoxin system VapC family toxin n=1 Tax=Ammoniphilus sp. 3BR4 TaxID=3158265 RepID=UPI00346646C6
MIVKEQATREEKSVFLDRSALAAFMDSTHPLHQKAVHFFFGLDDLQQPLITLNLTIYEMHEWLRNQVGFQQAHFFLNVIKRAEQAKVLTIIPIDDAIEQEALNLMLEHPEYEFTYLEACTFTVIHELGVYRIFSLDPNVKRIAQAWPEVQIVPT